MKNERKRAVVEKKRRRLWLFYVIKLNGLFGCIFMYRTKYMVLIRVCPFEPLKILSRFKIGPIARERFANRWRSSQVFSVNISLSHVSNGICERYRTRIPYQIFQSNTLSNKSYWIKQMKRKATKKTHTKSYKHTDIFFHPIEIKKNNWILCSYDLVHNLYICLCTYIFFSFRILICLNSSKKIKC